MPDWSHATTPAVLPRRPARTAAHAAAPEIWDTILSVNLSGASHTMRRAMPAMAERGYGCVVNIASVHGGDRQAAITSLLAEKQPGRRTSDPTEIGPLALWLCDHTAHNVTGTSIPVDGGWTAQ